jgi:hypothetical protein
MWKYGKIRSDKTRDQNHTNNNEDKRDKVSRKAAGFPVEKDEGA